MHIFEKNYRINFVDEADVFVGYQFEGMCCEEYGYRFCRTPNSANSLEEPNLPLLKDFMFDTNFFEDRTLDSSHPLAVGLGLKPDSERSLSVATFKLVAKDQVMYLELWNYHNGYYIHGFDITANGIVIHKGGL